MQTSVSHAHKLHVQLQETSFLYSDSPWSNWYPYTFQALHSKFGDLRAATTMLHRLAAARYLACNPISMRVTIYNLMQHGRHMCHLHVQHSYGTMASCRMGQSAVGRRAVPCPRAKSPPMHSGVPRESHESSLTTYHTIVEGDDPRLRC